LPGLEEQPMSVIKSAFFMKNLPPWERGLRILLSLVGAAVCLVSLSPPWSWGGVASAAGFGVTGVVGFCPMCALAGRRLPRQS
jgi:hypothetical protein